MSKDLAATGDEQNRSAIISIEQLRELAAKQKGSGLVEMADKLTVDLTRIEVVDNYAQKAEIDFGNLWRCFWAERNKAIILALLLVSLFVFGNKALLPDMYETRALVAVNLPNNHDGSIGSGFAVEEVLSRTVLEKTIDDLDLTNPGSKQAPLQAILAALSIQTEKRAMNKEAVVRDLIDSISVVPVDSESTTGRVRLFSVSMKHDDPGMAAKIVNGVVASFLATQGSNRNSASGSVTNTLETKIADLDQKIGVFDAEIAEIKTANSDLVGQDDILRSAFIDAKMQLNEATAAFREAEGKANHLKSTLAVEPKTLALSGANNTLTIDNLAPSEQLSIKRNMLESMRSKYTSDHPQLLSMIHEIKDLETAIRTGKTNIVSGPPNPEYQRLRSDLGIAEAQRIAASERANELRAQITEYQGKLSKLPGVVKVLANKEDKRETIAVEREELAKLLTVENIKSDNGFAVVEAGAIPTLPLIRSRLITNGAGLFAGIALSVILITIYGAIRNSALKLVDFDINPDMTRAKKVKGAVFYLITGGIFLYILFYIISQHLDQLFIIK